MQDARAPAAREVAIVPWAAGYRVDTTVFILLPVCGRPVLLARSSRVPMTTGTLRMVSFFEYHLHRFGASLSSTDRFTVGFTSRMLSKHAHGAAHDETDDSTVKSDSDSAELVSSTAHDHTPFTEVEINNALTRNLPGSQRATVS